MLELSRNKITFAAFRSLWRTGWTNAFFMLRWCEAAYPALQNTGSEDGTPLSRPCLHLLWMIFYCVEDAFSSGQPVIAIFWYIQLHTEYRLPTAVFNEIPTADLRVGLKLLAYCSLYFCRCSGHLSPACKWKKNLDYAKKNNHLLLPGILM